MKPFLLIHIISSFASLRSLLPGSTRFAVLAVSLCSAGIHPSSFAAEQRPNILFIMVDDLRTSLGCYGDPLVKSPNIDRLARSSRLFNHAYCHQAVCGPSRASILTGRLPDNTGVWHNRNLFRTTHPDLVTLPQLFKSNGYQALSMGKVFSGAESELDPSSWSAPEVLKGEGWKTYANKGNGEGKGAPFESADVPDDAYSDGKLANLAIDTLAKLKEQSQPFFLAVGFFKPHLPFNAPKKYWDLYDPSAFALDGKRTRAQGAPKAAYPDHLELAGYQGIPDDERVTPEQARQLRHGYYACISYTDAQIGKLLDALRQEDLEDNSIVVLLGDHGYSLGEADHWCKDTNFELDTHVPLMIRTPGMKHPGTATGALTEFVDIYPTLAALAKLTPPAGLDGRSLVPILEDPAAPGHDHVLSQFSRPFKAGNPEIMGYSLRTLTHRYTRWIEWGTRTVLADEVYDYTAPESVTRQDTHLIEKVNIAATSPLRETLSATLDQVLATRTHPISPAFSVLPGSPMLTDNMLDWTALPPIPDAEGFAGPFAGVIDDKLIVAGGANFPGAKPWEGGSKVWSDTIFALDHPQGNWREAGRLPRPLGYGVSITTGDGLICIGGSDSTQHHAEVFRLALTGNGIETTDLPSLPKPCANMGGALLGRTIFVAGGIERPDSTEAFHTLWTLDLDRLDAGWQTMAPWPGSGRMLAAAGAQDGSFYIVGGAALKPNADGKPERVWLKDGYRYSPGKGWKQIADTPQISVAAPSPMPTVGSSTLLLIGGDDGAQVTVDPGDHQGFPKTIFAYHTTTDTWRQVGQVPSGLVTTTTVAWKEQIVIPGGEKMPGTRSTEVWSARWTSKSKTPFGWFNYATLFAYLAGMVAIGWYCSRGNHTTNDYFKGGGNIPWWAAGMSIFATMLSSLTFMSVPAKAYMTDWTFVWANLSILLLAPFIIGIYLPFFRRLQITTAYEYLEERFNLAARLYGAAAFILFQLGRQAIVLLLPALALATVSDLDVRVCILLMGTLCVAYTTMGGIRAVIWTDVVQTFVLVGAALLTLVLVIAGTEGGIGGFFEIAQAHHKMNAFNWTWDPTTASNAFWVIIIGNLFINLVPYTSDQTVVQRYMTTKDEKSAARSIWTNALLAMPSTLLFFLIGTALFVFYHNHPDSLDAKQTPDAVFPAFILQNLPAGIAGMVIAGIFAAAQSTVSSSLNSVSTVLTTDLWMRLGWTTEAKSLRLAKTLTIAIGAFATVAALVLAELNLKSLWDAYNSLVGLAGSGLAGLFALGIFSKRAHGAGALIGALTSALVLYFVQQYTNLHFFLYAAVGILTCVGVGWIASIILPGPDKSLENLTLQ